MAGVRGYFYGSKARAFQFLILLKIEFLVAYKRFTDNVPLAIDYTTSSFSVSGGILCWY
jgi:hypothetical protein